jgi:hypothetical protein
MTHYEKQVLAYLWRVCAKHLRKQLQVAVKSAAKVPVTGAHVHQYLATALPSLSAMKTNLSCDGGKAVNSLMGLLSERVAREYPHQNAIQKAAQEVSRDASITILRCKLPPVRKAVKKRRPAAKPLTLVEKRAKLAAARVVEWERKGKLAKTKLAKYRKRVTYYKKKGAV